MTEPTLDPEDVRRYVERWRLVNELELAALRATPPEVKLKQLDSLRDFLTDLDVQVLDDEDRAVRRRWVRLREVLGG
jgi:hypothetical protein